MVRNALTAVTLALIVAAPAHAQSKKFELNVTGGWIFSEGASGDTFVTPIGTFNGISVKSGPSIGLSFAVLTEGGGEVGFQWGRQMSKLTVEGVPTYELGDMNIDNYHAMFGYNTMPGAKVRPYVTIGLGATDYRPVTYSLPGRSGEINGSVRFSFKLGLGVKSWGNDAIGWTAVMNWTPTGVSSEDSGWWCDPFFGCYVTTNFKFSNQFELAGGVVFRFGG